MKSTETKSKFIELRAQGLSYNKISKQLKVSKTTLVSWAKELKYDIENATQFEKDILIEKYKMAQNQRLESLFKMFEKLNTELENRPLNKLSTEKLVNLTQQTYLLINKELRPVEHVERAEYAPLDIGWTDRTQI